MPFIKELNKDFEIKDKRIVLSKQYMKDNAWKFKKITGTKLASICNAGDFASPFKTWCEMVGIYKEEMPQVLSRAGQILEPMIRERVSKQLGIKFKDYKPQDIHYDLFHLDDRKAESERVYGGIPDGEALDKNGNIVNDKNHPILEIKTMSIDKFLYKKVDGVFTLQTDDLGYPIVKVLGEGKRKHFVNGEFIVPIEYQYQLALYLILRKAKYGMFAAVFLKTDDYKTPDSVNVNDREMKLVRFTVNDSILESIEYGKQWYKKYIKGGISPLPTEKDLQWLKEVGLTK